MSWFFPDRSEYLSKLAHESVNHINASDHAINQMFSNIDWPRKRKLESKKKLAKKEKFELLMIKERIDSYEIESLIHKNLAHQLNKMLPKELQDWW